ncbi:MAG: efflux RND transporter periplasmic adaptor subunit [Thiotrichales bacterium]|jgi:RND family efflux transporter MFP subunit|nr:efflux RND transporter periplasmic adaptor subunit [Thiotrichales bacterium]
MRLLTWFMAAAWSLMTGCGYAGVETVTAEAYDAQVVLGGTVVPYREVVLTAQVAGRVNYLGGIEGDRFNAGDLLVAIDDTDLQAQRRATIAQFNKAQSGLANAQTEYQRELWNPQSRSTSKMPGFAMPSMFDQMFSRPMGRTLGFEDDRITRQADLYNRNVGVQQASADVMQAQATIDELDAKIRDARAQAPFSGIVIKKMVEAGDTVSPGQPLLKYAQNGHLCIEVNIPVRLMGRLERGDIVAARLDQVGDTQARVAQVYPVADAQQHTVKVKFDLPVGVSAGPGMYAEVLLPNAMDMRESMPSIPKNALVQRGSLPSVYVVNDQDVLALRVVRLGRSLPNDRVVVLSGVKAGERIVTSPPKAVASGWVVHGDDVIPR